MHLFSEDQPDNVQVICQFLLPSLVSLGSLLRLRESTRTLLLAAGQPVYAAQKSVSHVVLKLLPIHDELVEEVELTPAGLVVDEVGFVAILDELLHLIVIQLQVRV